MIGILSFAGFTILVAVIAYLATRKTDESSSDAILARIPAGRWGQPDDFKGPIVFLCSEASVYMNGVTMLVDGGWMGR